MIPDFALSCSESESVGLTLSREQYEKLSIYAEFLVEYNEKVNLTAITEPMEILRSTSSTAYFSQNMLIYR